MVLHLLERYYTGAYIIYSRKPQHLAVAPAVFPFYQVRDKRLSDAMVTQYSCHLRHAYTFGSHGWQALSLPADWVMTPSPPCAASSLGHSHDVTW